jgi:site-specific DNA recombinase
VTAKTRCYGFKRVDSSGSELHARKDTHYAIVESEAEIVVYIYMQIAFQKKTLRQLARELPTIAKPLRATYLQWSETTIRGIIRNPVYKGEFAARRWEVTKVLEHTKEGVKAIQRRVERPKDEWIIVPVPPIVSAELWERANRALAKNKETSARNGKRSYLLTGLVKCAKCGLSYVGSYEPTVVNG